MEQFDLHVTATEAQTPIVHVDGYAFDISREGILEVGVSLDTARSVKAAAKQAGASVWIVPVEYRHPLISFEEAFEIAEHIRLTTIKERHWNVPKSKISLRDFEAGYRYLKWWRFVAMIDGDPDLYPGTVTVAVDILDGHIRKDEEWRQLLELQDVSKS